MWNEFLVQHNLKYISCIIDKYFADFLSSNSTNMTKVKWPVSMANRYKIQKFVTGFCFLFFVLKSLPANSRHSNGYELCPSSRRHLSVFIRSGFRTTFALNGKDTFSISVQSHLQVYRWCIVHKQPRIRKIIWARCILLNLRSKTQQRQQLLLLT